MRSGDQGVGRTVGAAAECLEVPPRSGRGAVSRPFTAATPNARVSD